MKTLKTFLLTLYAIFLTVNIAAQSHDHSKMNADQTVVKTELFKVWGQCDMCKTRIEKTVKAEGATAASWDAKSQLLTVTFDPSKTSQESLSKKLASVGHDTEKFKAPDDVYSKLPGCCHYERQK